MAIEYFWVSTLDISILKFFVANLGGLCRALPLSFTHPVRGPPAQIRVPPIPSAGPQLRSACDPSGPRSMPSVRGPRALWGRALRTGWHTDLSLEPGVRGHGWQAEGTRISARADRMITLPLRAPQLQIRVPPILSAATSSNSSSDPLATHQRAATHPRDVGPPSSDPRAIYPVRGPRSDPHATHPAKRVPFFQERTLFFQNCTLPMQESCRCSALQCS